VYCQTYASYAAAVAAVREQGEVLINPKTGHAHKNPMVTVLEIAAVICGCSAGISV
jgi:phage terminase small subunit